MVGTNVATIAPDTFDDLISKISINQGIPLSFTTRISKLFVQFDDHLKYSLLMSLGILKIIGYDVFFFSYSSFRNPSATQIFDTSHIPHWSSISI